MGMGGGGEWWGEGDGLGWCRAQEGGEVGMSSE
jgi:hypothetical protein